MGFGIRLRRLWHLRTGVAISLALALLAALWSVQKISLFPPGMEPRALEMATASTHVIVDTPNSAMLDLRQDTYSLEGLTNRAVLLGNVISSTPVQAAIARRAGVPLERLHISAPLTRQLPQGRADADSKKSMSDITKSTDEYNVSIQANPTVPMLDIYAQTPDSESAANVANATVEELRAYLGRLAHTKLTPAKDQIRLVQLGRAEGTVINEGVHWQVALLAFVLTFAATCATAIFIARVRDGWHMAAESEQAATA